MTDELALYKRLTFAVCASLVINATGCNNNDTPEQPQPFATRVSRGSTIAISEDDARVAMVNEVRDASGTANLARGRRRTAIRRHYRHYQ